MCKRCRGVSSALPRPPSTAGITIFTLNPQWKSTGDLPSPLHPSSSVCNTKWQGAKVS